MKSIGKSQTPTTPSIPHLYALNRQLDNILAEGPERRFERHRRMADFVRNWAKKNFELFAQPGYESQTLTVIKNTRNIDVGSLNKELQQRGMIIANGYGAIKDKTFRIKFAAAKKAWPVSTKRPLKACWRPAMTTMPTSISTWRWN